MSWETALWIYAGLLGVLLLSGVPIGAALGLTGLTGVTMVGGTRLWPTLGSILWNNTQSFTLVAIPLFVFMGEIILRTGVSKRFYAALATMLAPFPGGLAHANIAGCAVFAAMSGSSVATALTMGTVALPEMEARGYDRPLTAGSLAAGGTLGILIPPSIPMIIYGAMVNESVVNLFIAGVIPGILLSAIFMTYIAVHVGFSPHLAPADRSIRLGTRVVLHALGDCWAVVLLVASIMGGMYLGVVTPTEAAGFGCLVAALIGLWYRELTWAKLYEALRNAVITTCTVMFIIVNGLILSFAVVDAGIARGVSNAIVQAHLSGWQFFTILFILYLILGMFIEGISMMLLTVPVIYTSVLAIGLDSVWFGVMLVIFIELAALTPPVGLNLFAIQSVSGGWPMTQVVKGSLPFAIIISLFSYLLFMFPEIALWLPRTINNYH